MVFHLMRRVICTVLLFCFFAAPFVCVGCKPKDQRVSEREILEQLSDFDPNAIVVLAYLGRYQHGATMLWPRVAFAIGDGTLILTAAHCVYGFTDPRQQAVSPDIVVVSPYYGDVFDFEVLAVDKEADLAILKASWPAHPALSLGSQDELKDAKKIIIASRPCTPRGGLAETPWNLTRQIRAEELPVRAPRDEKPCRAIALKGTRYAVKGWSGSALVLPRTGKVVGVLTGGVLASLTKVGDNKTVRRKDAEGCGISSIQKLLKQHNLQSRAGACPVQLPCIADANQGFALAIDYVECLLNKDLTGALDIAKRLVAMRPQSVQARLFLAFSAYDAYALISSTEQLRSLAESSFKQALALQPENACAHAGYSSFLLEQKRYEQALAEAETALAIDPNNELALANRVCILTATDPNKAEKLAHQLVKKDPNNPHWWYWYYGALAKLGQREKALEAARTAVELNPDGLYQGGLADALVKLHRIDDAESYYKQMTQRCGCQLCWYKYADFLVGYRPERLGEAEKALDEAESKKARRVSKESLISLRLRLLQKKAPEKGEALARQLLEKTPENAEYWYHLAGILRAQNKHQEAVEAAGRAVQLDPDGPYRPRLADCLAKAGRLDESERTYKQMLRDHPDRARYWYWYAKFLCYYFPDRLEEARRSLEKARDPHKDWSVAPADLAELSEKIEARQNARDNTQDN